MCFMKEELTDINFWVNEASVMEINLCYLVMNFLNAVLICFYHKKLCKFAVVPKNSLYMYFNPN